MMDGLAAPKIPLLIKNVKVVNTLVMCDRGRDVRGIASEVDICFGSVQSIVTEILGMSKVLARYRPRILTDDQKRTWFDISHYLVSRYEDDPDDFFERVVTEEQAWVYHFDQESNMQSKQWNHPGSLPHKKFKRVHSA